MMNISGKSLIDLSKEEIWPLIFNPATLFYLLPGCDQIEQVAEGVYQGRMKLGIAAIAGTYQVEVRILEHQVAEMCRLWGEISGRAGQIKGEAVFTLAPNEDKTWLEYSGKAQISGPLAGMNSRFIEGVAKTLIQQGLNRLPALARERREGQTHRSA
jgi:carbon monoxide dehydrogenase subunit G